VTRPRRAEPLAPDERRLAIIDAVVPLLIAQGASVTTRQMAEAAGIAEGTLFSVFPDKRALILAAIEHQLDPEPLRAGLAAIDPAASLVTRLTEAAQIVAASSADVYALGAVLRTMPQGEKQPAKPQGGPPRFITAWSEAINQGVTELLEPHRSQLRLAPSRAATMFVGLLFASQHAFPANGDRLTIDEIVTVLLNGALKNAARDAAATAADDVNHTPEETTACC
jgi:AcrR family transcriptional regulator